MVLGDGSGRRLVFESGALMNRAECYKRPHQFPGSFHHGRDTGEGCAAVLEPWSLDFRASLVALGIGSSGSSNLLRFSLTALLDSNWDIAKGVFCWRDDLNCCCWPLHTHLTKRQSP